VIIDFHTHFHKDQGRIEDLIAAMDAQGVDIAVVSAVVPPGGDNGRAANAFVHEAVKAYPSRLVGLAGVVPYLAEAPDMLEAYVHSFGFRGLKIHPSVQQFFPSDPRIFSVIEKAIELDLPVLIHTGVVPIPGTRSRYDDPLEMDDLALVYPEAKLVMAHGDPFGAAPAIAGKHPNVYMDTTTTFARFARLIPGLGEDTLKFMGLVSGESGSSKVIFGSDANPLKTQRLEENLTPIRALDIPDEERALILGGNAARLLKLTQV
jgi:predicted TIM-barrel fold metal-dependent hydrolase